MFLNSLAFLIVTGGGSSKMDFGAINLGLKGQELEETRRGSHSNDQESSCHRIQRPRVTNALGLEPTSKDSDDIVGRHFKGLID